MQTVSEHLPAQAHASELDFEDRTYRKVVWRILPVLLLCYMAAYLDRIHRLNPVFNAIVNLAPDDRLLAEADEVRGRLQAL